jgi:hypothetical protein
MLPAAVREIAVTPMGYRRRCDAGTSKRKSSRSSSGRLRRTPSRPYCRTTSWSVPSAQTSLRSVIEAAGWFAQRRCSSTTFHGGTFFARIFVHRRSIFPGNNLLELDARPSDAIALAVRFKSRRSTWPSMSTTGRPLTRSTLREADAEALRTAGEGNVDEILDR